ncbi:class F sortase [Streptomyces monticola]|uniref:Class F sortase n=1 Tax=Streptomyces monticola TaxID=2666263 RepID=A0ABW2JN36_9ACTN
MPGRRCRTPAHRHPVRAPSTAAGRGAGGGAPRRPTATGADGAAHRPLAPGVTPDPGPYVPAIGVDAPLTALSLEQDGRLAAPPADRPRLAGRYARGTPPGSTGTAAIAGHVDTDSGPAVFYRLGALQAGERVLVDRSDGTTAEFTVDTVAVHDADRFPDEKVYGRSARPELRLITCGGGADAKNNRYRGNVVVYAHLG